MCSKSRFPCLFFPCFSRSLRLALSWERSVVWTACARPGLSYWRFCGFGWCDFMELHLKAPDSAVFLSDSNLGVGENNPRAGKLMQHLGGKCWEGKSMGRQLLEITDIWFLIAIKRNYCRYSDTPFAKFWEIPQLIVATINWHWLHLGESLDMVGDIPGISFVAWHSQQLSVVPTVLWKSCEGMSWTYHLNIMTSLILKVHHFKISHFRIKIFIVFQYLSCLISEPNR